MKKQLEILKALLEGKQVYDSEGNALVLFGNPTARLKGCGESTTFQVSHLDQFTLTPPPNKPLTFERIKKECVSGKHLLVDEYGRKRLFIGFNRAGGVVTDFEGGGSSTAWGDYQITDWTIEEYKVGRGDGYF